MRLLALELKAILWTCRQRPRTASTEASMISANFNSAESGDVVRKEGEEIEFTHQ